MLFAKYGLAALLTTCLALGADKKLPIEQTSNELLEISASLITKDQVQQELGGDLGPDMVVVRVTFRPVSDKPLRIDRDDFLLVSAKDGQRSEPYAPSQIAGSATLVVTPTGVRSGGGLGAQSGGPVWGGGIPGTGPVLGPFPGGGSAGSTTTETETDAKVEMKKSDKENPLLASLTAKCLPEKETLEAVSGLLYFQMDGKLKPKDLELHYRGVGGRLALRFHP